jgi:hypothetical protein
MNLRTCGCRLALAGLALAWPRPSRALFGAGDIVFDPANVAQTINVLHQVQQEVDTLGSLLGVSTRQFDQLVQLTTAMGSATVSGPGAVPPPADRLQTLLQGVPGLQNQTASGLLNPTGQLDAFLGLPLSGWITAVEHPLTFYRQVLVAPAIERAGGAAGLDSGTVAYLQQYAGVSAEDQFTAGTHLAGDLAQLMAADWLAGARERRLNLQALAAGGQAAEAQAGAARTQADQQSAQAQLAATTNRILLETAAQHAAALEAQVRTAGAQQRLQADDNAARRDAAEMALDGSD